ncbi:ATPase-like protein 15 [Elsinoe australis]|uniref:ATPase-like protein 15 n=1 Tax=Elsinoe australis TaxID=40998 RepID=A0A4U7AQF4_9PEZI|nr:ATPase-like protein 15 [Elsinoe australis]
MRSNAWRSSLRQLPRRNLDDHIVQRFSTSPRPQPKGKHAISAAPIAARSCSNQQRWNSTAPAEGNQPAKPGSAPERAHTRSHARRKENASNGIPPPPPLPDWFLQYNVRLQEGEQEQGQHRADKARALFLLDPYDDAELLTIPYVEPYNAREIIQQMKDARLPGSFFSSSGDLKDITERISERHEQVIAKAEEHLKKEEEQEAKVKEEQQVEEKKAEEKLKLPELKQVLDEASWARLQGQLLIYATFQSMAQPDRKTSPRNLIVYSPEITAHDELDRFVEDAADLAHADIIRIDASDIAELAGDYVDPVDSGPGSIAGLAFDAYEGGQVRNAKETIQPPQSPDQAEPRDNAEQSREDSGPFAFDLDALRSGNSDVMKSTRKQLEKLLGGQVVGLSVGMPMQNMFRQQESSRDSKQNEVDEVSELDRWQRLKLKNFFENLLGAPAKRRQADLSNVPHSFIRQKFADIKSQFKNPDTRRELHDAPAQRQQELTKQYGRKKLANDSLRLHLAQHVNATFGDDRPATAVVRKHEPRSPVDSSSSSGTIIHLRDISLIYDSPHGEDIVKLLKHAVQNRQKNGEKIMIVGTDAEFSGDVSTPLAAMEEDDLDKEEGFLRINYTPSPFNAIRNPPLTPMYPVEPGYRRLLELNLRNVQDLITRLGIPCSPRFFSEMTRSFLYAPRTQKLGDSVLPPSQIHKIVLTAEGFRSLYTTSKELEMSHLAIALSIIDVLEQSNQVINVNVQQRGEQQPRQPSQFDADPNVADQRGERQKRKRNESKRTNLEELRKFASKHEQRLFPGIVDPASIKTTYNDVHVAPETIDALKTVTTLALLRPEAFSYGVLAKDRLTGLLLYGPPGTGKTLLAKAVAKDAQATVLEVSGAQVYEKYVGEGEKMVRAVFSLAKRLSPCVVFIDEADALFGSRGQSGNRTTHREIINQFLREWDGMDDHNVFLMVASNRPFEIDDAVLRRLPRRILVDLPTKQDRESILKIHSTGELLADDVELSQLAEQTPFYSGSDLKNVCVAAALAAVKEENQLLEKNKDDKEFKLPDRRTLKKEHFEKAIQEISASISEDMRSLNAIKKFDEQYGDRKGRRKKEGYGFAGTTVQEDEAAARVRGAIGPKP